MNWTLLLFQTRYLLAIFLLLNLFVTTGLEAQPDLLVSAIRQIPDRGDVGSVQTFTFDLENRSGIIAAGAYRITHYLSTNKALERNIDKLVGEVNTGNTPSGLIADIVGAFAIDASIPPGKYFLILVVDEDNAISESNENNNISASFQTIDVVINGGVIGTSQQCGEVMITHGNHNIHIAGQADEGYFYKIYDLNDSWAEVRSCSAERK